MAITLFDMLRLKEDEYEQGVVETFIMESDIGKNLSFETIDTVQINTRRFNSLPSVSFRQRGQRYSQGNVGIEHVSDAVYPLGAEITIDKIDLRDKSPFQDPLTFHTQAHVKSMAYEFNDYFVNGDHAVDPNGFEGIKTRIANYLAASQTLYGNTSSAVLDVRAATLGAASLTTAQSTALQFLEALDRAQYSLDGHKADLCITDADGIRALKNCLRYANAYVDPAQTISTDINQRATSAKPPTKAAFVWGDCTYIDAGVKIDQTTHIVATDSSVASTACRPFYFARLGDPYIQGIQEYPMEVSQSFQLDDGVSFRVVIDWPVGIRHVHPRSASQLLGVQVA